jgi:hypothetical protein
MAWTVADLEAELWGAFGPLLTLVKLSTVVDGSRPALRSVIRDAVEAAGGTVANPPEVTDDDIATIPVGHLIYRKLADLYILEKIWGNWALVDMKKGTTEQKLSQLADRIQKKIEELKKELADPDSPIASLGIPIPAAEVGKIIAGSYVPHDPFFGRFGDRFPY